MALFGACEAPLEACHHIHLYKMAQGYIQDPARQEEHLQMVKGRQTDVERLGRKLRFGGGERR
jgi:hypothetical protein